MSGFNVVDGGRARQRSAKRLFVGDGEKSFFSAVQNVAFGPKRPILHRNEMSSFRGVATVAGTTPEMSKLLKWIGRGTAAMLAPPNKKAMAPTARDCRGQMSARQLIFVYAVEITNAV